MKSESVKDNVRFERDEKVKKEIILFRRQRERERESLRSTGILVSRLFV